MARPGLPFLLQHRIIRATTSHSILQLRLSATRAASVSSAKESIVRAINMTIAMTKDARYVSTSSCRAITDLHRLSLFQVMPVMFCLISHLEDTEFTIISKIAKAHTKQSAST